MDFYRINEEYNQYLQKYYWDKWNVICGEAALFWMSKWKDRIVIQYVYRTTI